MKIVALLPFKNERWILPTYLSSVSRVADEIIALDDGSTDEGGKLLADAGVTVETFDSHPDGQCPMSTRRKRLLELGRNIGGTHFIWLDADEAFTAPFLVDGRRIISKLKPGQKLLMQWLALWRSVSYFRDDDSVWSNNFKDFIVCDHPDFDFEERFLSEGRTQGPNMADNLIRLEPENGAVLHFQFLHWERFQIKQAWYRCLELVNSPDSVNEINETYSITLDDPTARVKAVDDEWLIDIELPSSALAFEDGWHLKEIFKLFDKWKPRYFEPLQIWHIEMLREQFYRIEGRYPKEMKPNYSTKFQSWSLRERIKNTILRRFVR